MLFKILHGDSSNISTDITPFHEGWCYVTHNGYFYFDINIGTEDSPNNQRIKLNAQEAEKITGYDIATIINSSDLEIPTSKAILDALSLKQDVITGTEGQYVGFDSDGNTASFDLPSEVIISDTAPTDENVEIWINTSEEWNDNIAGGASSWNDLTDKPFDENNVIKQEALPEGYPYKEQSRTEYAVPGEVWFDDHNGDAPVGIYRQLVSEPFVSGEKYLVVFDGKSYDVTAEEFTEAGMIFQTVGNKNLQGSSDFADTGEPFSAATMGNSDVTELVLNALPTETNIHTVEIYKLTETIHTMAPEFLPAGVGGGAYMMELKPSDYSMSSGGMVVPSISYDPILDALDKGQMVFIKVWYAEDEPMPYPMIVFYVAMDDNGYLLVNDAGGGVVPITFQTGKHTV